MNQFYTLENNKMLGPFNIEELKNKIKEGNLNSRVRVWCDGMDDWTEAGKMKELKELFHTDENKQ